MSWITKRSGTILTVVLILTVTVVSVLYLAKLKQANDTVLKDVNIVEDGQIPYALSNLSGVSAEEIIELQARGLSWNEVVEQLQMDHAQKGVGNVNGQDSLMSASGLSKQLLQQLTTEEYTQEQILNATMMAERLLFQLTEINRDLPTVAIISKPTAAEEIGQNEVAKAQYAKLQEQFSLEDAIKLMLKWEEVAGGMRQAINEYLFMLQAEFAVEQYINDWQLYMENKESVRQLSFESIWITIEQIERELLEILKARNESDDEQAPISSFSHTDLLDNHNAGVAPQVPNPDVMDIKPVNPAQAIYDELKVLDPREDLR